MNRWLVLGVLAILVPPGYRIAIDLGDAWQIERLDPPRAELVLPAPLPPPRPPPPPPPPAPGPPTVAPHQLTQVSGQRDIQPPDAVRVAMTAAGKPRLVGVFEVCLDTLGRVSEVKRLTSTGYDTYDKRLWAAMWNWRYQPFMADGRPIEVCTAITFVFTIK